MKLIAKDNTTLRSVAKQWDFEKPPEDLIELRDKLINTMIEEGGIGLAAPQVGVPYRVFVMRGEGAEESMLMVNPEIVDHSVETASMEEGCLTGGLEGIFCILTRPESIRARWQNEDGDVRELGFGGMSGRCFQHELDHLNGILFVDHASHIKLERAIKKKNKRKKKYDRFVKQLKEFTATRGALPTPSVESEGMQSSDKVSQSESE